MQIFKIKSAGTAVGSIFAIAAIIGGCSQTQKYPADVEAVLQFAGENRPELEKVIAQYQRPEDSLKLAAAYFLIGNMEGHSYVTYYLHDSAGVELPFDVTAFPDYDHLVATIDSIEKERGTVDYDKRETIEDAQTITAAYLINQIDLAFQAWREKPWARYLTFEQFRDYVLPYRGSNEPLEPWRQEFLEKYADIAGQMSDSTDPVEAAAIINNNIRSWFTFDPRWYYHPTDQGLDEMKKNGLGRCEDMTNVTIYAMRANGIAVTSDYTPYWATTGNNHAWNAILERNGSVVPFMGAEANPGEYKIGQGAAKVYRKTYGQQKGNLCFQEHKQTKLPGWLNRSTYTDVTPAYVEVASPTITFGRPVPDSVDIAYMSVFNSGEWKPIDWGRVVDGAAGFRDMGTNLAYLPTLYINEKNIAWGDPFILESGGDLRMLHADSSSRITVRLTSTTRRNQSGSQEGIEKSYLKKGATYELFYFDDGWQSLGERVATDKPLQFAEVPAGGLYWLVEKGSNKEERIFTVEDGRQVWW